MLSRVANSLYWMSRYIERAESIGRIVEVNLQLLLDLQNPDEEQMVRHWLPLVQTTGDEQQFFHYHNKATGGAVTEFLVFQAENPNSLVSSICQARENARMIRDQIAMEFWEELNRLYLFVKMPDARRIWKQSPAEFFQQVRSSSLQLIGLGYSALLRNEGWWFMQAGKFLERADKTSRILDVRSGAWPGAGAPPAAGTEALGWSAVLHSCSAWDSYRSLYGMEVNRHNVAEFLLLNDDFPRSVLFCANQLNDALRRISGVAAGRFCNEAEKLSGRLVAELQFGTADEIFSQDLHGYLDSLQSRLNDIGDALFDAYIVQRFDNPGGEILVQQEEQQQQMMQNAPVSLREHGHPQAYPLSENGRNPD